MAGQSISKITGVVRNPDGIPIEGADVVVMGTAYGAATDISGFFDIGNLFAGEYTIRISHVGYKSQIKKNIIVTKDTPSVLHIVLEPDIAETDEILVLGQKDTTISTLMQITISSEQIRKSSARTLGDFLMHIPGITIIDEGAGSATKRISIRGSNPNQVIVLLDGISLNDPLSGEVDLSLIPLSVIEDITITKGGNSAEHGSGGIGGSVEITSRQNFLDQLSLAGNIGSFGARGFQPRASGNIHEINYFASYEYLKEKGDYPYTFDSIDGQEKNTSRVNAGFDARQYFLKLGYSTGVHNLTIQANIFQSNRGLPGTIYFLTPYASADVQRKILSLNYNNTGERGSFSAQLSAYSNKSEYLNKWPADPPLIYKKVPPYHSLYDLTTYQGSLNGTYDWLPRNHMSLQLLVRRDIFKDEDLLYPKINLPSETDNRQIALGLENTWNFPMPQWLDYSQLKISLRYDRIKFNNAGSERSDTYLSPKAGIFIGYHREWTINFRANAGKSFRSPTFADLYYQDFRVNGNADLLPEKSQDSDIGFELAPPWLNRPEFSVSYFRQEINQLIVWELGSFATWQPVNLNAFIDGWEYGFSWQIWPSFLKLNLNHIFLNARDRSGRHTTNDKFLIYRPRNTTKILMEINYYPVTVQYNKRIVDERYVTAANTVSLPRYTVDDVSVMTELSADDVKILIKFMLLNLFDTQYQIIENAPLPGRHWRAGIELTY